MTDYEKLLASVAANADRMWDALAHANRLPLAERPTHCMDCGAPTKSTSGLCPRCYAESAQPEMRPAGGYRRG